MTKMPPKKRSRRGVSTPARDDDGMEIDAPTPDVEEQNEPPTPAYDILKDPWTDEQETALFKAIIKWKPNGNVILKVKAGIVLTQHRRTQALSNDCNRRISSK